jgi:hypothetical protein
LGEGRVVFNNYIQDSDIGYVNQMFIGGGFYLLILCVFILFMYKNNLKFSEDRFYPLLFIFVILIANIKGSAFFTPNGFLRIYSLYYIYCIFSNHYLKNESNSSINYLKD